MRKILLLGILIFVVSCGDGGDEGFIIKRREISFIKFFDSTVENLKVVGSISGVHLTNSSGEIECETGENLDYYIANIKLGSSKCDGETHNPTTIIESNLNGIEDAGPLAIGILLQSFNENNNLNSIKLPEEIHGYDYSSVDLENSFDLNNDGIPDELDNLIDEIKEKSPEANAVYEERTLSDVLKHYKISFGSNATYNLNIINTEEVPGVGACPESISIQIKNEIVKSSIGGGSELISLNDFEMTIESYRNMVYGDFLQILRTNSLTYSQYYDCSADDSMYSYTEISIAGNVDPENSNNPISGDYDLTLICDNGIHTICEGTF